jgi:hypothetical protein
MADIIINVDALVCEAPVVTHSEWTGARYVFNVDWTSIGDQLATFDPTVRMEVGIIIYQNTTTPPQFEYSGVIDSNGPFNATGFSFDVVDYFPTFSSKFDLYLTLKLISDASCNEETTYQFPIDYP